MSPQQTETPLVLVGPGDGAAEVLAKARGTGSPRVQLLVPEGPAALQRPGEMDHLASMAAAESIGLVLISSDAATLDAARRASIATLAVRGATVRAPAAQAPHPDPAHPAGADESFLAALDDMDATPARGGGVQAEEAAAAASLAAALRRARPPAGQPALSDDELLAAVLDREPGQTPPRAARPPQPALPPTLVDGPRPTRRLPPEPEAAAALPTRPPPPEPEAAAPRPRPAPPETQAAAPRPTRPAPPEPEAAAPRPTRPAPPEPEAAAPRPRPRPASPAPEAWERTAPRSGRRFGVIIAGALALLAIIVAIGAYMLWSSRVAVSVTPPVRPDTVEPVEALPVPVVPPGGGPTKAVVAAPVSSQASFTASAEVSEVTMTPAGSAGGALTIFNSSPQSLPLPIGTEFVAVLPDGREVPFVSTAEVMVPGATTSDTGAQIITSRGQASVTVTARSPGSGSNVEGNTIRRVVPPGGPPFNVDSGSFIVQHPALTGGSEEEIRIVKDSNVLALLPEALEGLDAAGRRLLDEQARAQGLAVESSTITPRRSELERLEGFDRQVQPAEGQPLEPGNPRFTLTVTADYAALGVPAAMPLSQQLGPALTEVLLQAGRIRAGDCRAPTVTGWSWDGGRLLVEGEIVPDTLSPSCQGGLEPSTLARVREAVRGKSRAEAQAALDALVAEGLIGGYTLPDTPRLPTWDWQLTING